jgi:hypothetical protein
MAYNNFPIYVDDLNTADLHAQFDQNGVVSTGSSTTVPAPVIGSLGQVGDNVVLQIKETVSTGNSWTALLTSRAFSMAKTVATVASYFFEVTTSYLRWTDASGNTTSFQVTDGTSQLAFSNSVVSVLSGSNSLIGSVDSTNMTVGNNSQALSLNGTGVYISDPFQISKTLLDKTGEAGTAGQVLSSTSTGVQWISNGTGAVNTVDGSYFTLQPLTSGVAQPLQSASLPAGSYIVTYSANVIFAPLAGAGIQESEMKVEVGHGSDIFGVSKDSTIRNIVTYSQNFWVDISTVVDLPASGKITANLSSIWIGGAGATITATASMKCTLVNV